MKKECEVHNFIEVGGRCTECGISSVSVTEHMNTDQNNKSMEVRFAEEFASEFGYLSMEGISPSTLKEFAEQLKDFIRTLLDERDAELAQEYRAMTATFKQLTELATELHKSAQELNSDLTGRIAVIHNDIEKLKEERLAQLSDNGGQDAN